MLVTKFQTYVDTSTRVPGLREETGLRTVVDGPDGGEIPAPDTCVVDQVLRAQSPLTSLYKESYHSV